MASLTFFKRFFTKNSLGPWVEKSSPARQNTLYGASIRGVMLFSYGLVVSFCKFITGKRTRDSGGEGNGIHVFKNRQTAPERAGVFVFISETVLLLRLKLLPDGQRSQSISGNHVFCRLDATMPCPF